MPRPLDYVYISLIEIEVVVPSRATDPVPENTPCAKGHSPMLSGIVDDSSSPSPRIVPPAPTAAMPTRGDVTVLSMRQVKAGASIVNEALMNAAEKVDMFGSVPVKLL